MIVLGIDPGLSGGLSFIEGGPPSRLLGSYDVPTTGEKAKRRVNVGEIILLLKTHRPDHAFIERGQAMPDQGASSGFNYGRAIGALEAIVQGMRIPLTIIESTAWKKFHGLIKTEKEDSRQRAIMLFPDATEFARKLDHNRAESALIAAYGFATLTKTYSPKSPASKRTSRRREPAQIDLLDPVRDSG